MLNDSLPFGVFNSFCILGKKATAGIFNEAGPGNTAIKSADGDGRKSYEEYKYSGTDAAGTHRLREQTMLCRTAFAVVTKQQADTLQITWTIEFSDNTT